jgi:hypothetical protein
MSLRAVLAIMTVAIFAWLGGSAHATACDHGACSTTSTVVVKPKSPTEVLVYGSSNQGSQNNYGHDLPGGHGHPGGGPVVPPPTYILDPQVRTDPQTGQPCVYVGQTPGDPSSAAEAAAEAKAQLLLSRMGLCSNSPPIPRQASPGAAAAEAFEKDVKLPAPTFEIPPGYSITGTKAFMQIGGPKGIDPAPIQVFGYQVVLHITSSYDIDWGDQSADHIEKNVQSQGGPYPDGDVWHVYDAKGTYPVTVTQRWTATYQILGAALASGTIADVLSTTTTQQLPVSEAQAVIDG